MLMIIQRIHHLVSQIVNDVSSSKPDLFCSKDQFNILKERPDCRVHPLRKDSIIMDPNIYWSVDPEMLDNHINANNSRGLLTLEYMELVDQFLEGDNANYVVIKDLIDVEQKKKITL